MKVNRQKIVEEKDWRVLFAGQEDMVKTAETESEQKKVKENSGWYYGQKVYEVKDSPRKVYQVRLFEIPKKLGQQWNASRMGCSCPESMKSHGLCQHIADALYAFEKKNGKVMAEETDWQYRERIKREEIACIREERENKRKELAGEPVSAGDFFADRKEMDGLVFFDMKKAVSEYETDAYYMERAREILKKGGYGRARFELLKSKKGELSIIGNMRFDQDYEWGDIEVRMDSGHIQYVGNDVHLRDDGNIFYGMDQKLPNTENAEEDLLEEYDLVMLSELWDYVEQMDFSRQTDEAAEKFFNQLEKARLEEEQKKEVVVREKEASLEIAPRIIIEDGKAMLGFKAGRVGDRLLIIRNLSSFAEAVRTEGTFEMSKTLTLDFAREDFREESQPVLSLLVHRVQEIDDTNQALEKQGTFGRGRYAGYSKVRALPVKANQDLKGSILDRFYDAVEDTDCEYTDKSNGIKSAMIRIGYRPIHFKLTADRLSDVKGAFAGVVVSGLVPVILRGASGGYTIDKEHLSRITRKEERALKPFTAVSDESGYFRFQVGKERLQEFYYRVIPTLLENPRVSFEDNCEEEAAQFLPPEPEFTFFFDMEEDRLEAEVTVAYDEKKYNISNKGGGYRDEEQERRVKEALVNYCPQFDEDKKKFFGEMDEDSLYEFLTDGVSRLSRYGEVKGTDAFHKAKVASAPSVRVGISVESGILNLSVTSKDYDEDELLAVLESYRRKKRYHRLKNGEFVTLEGDEQLSQLEQFFGDMELTPIDVVKKNIHMPLYRALYIDRLLKDHESLVNSRDRTFRALIRNFNEVKDSDYEVSESLADVVRPYQAYGHKWLRTIENAGFGGILADEMGLGKTLELITVLLGAYEDGNRLPSLIVVPASVVYNWQEELRRFAKAVPCVALAGTLAERRKIFAGMGADKEGSVYVTSYDLLKRDIASYENTRFYICALDEAQVIKNQKAAVTKAVKVIKADHRFALTGTPIENRLSELWSIFDFLMPGFLYKLGEFEDRFARPITKEKDPKATRTLKKMVSPFILRRKKEEVLKDLPEKLEEVSYARLSGEQQKIYDGQVVRLKRLLGSAAGTGEERIKVLAELTKTRQICCDPSLVVEGYRGESAKRQALMDLIRRGIDGGHRMLVFSQFVSMIELMKADLDGEGISYYEITGATSKEKRLSLVRDFNNGDVPVFLISLRAGGVGLNLTGADVVIHYDPWWNQAVMNQATDRAHRIGQTRQVTVYKMILKDTIEERIMELQDRKRDLADAILEGKGESLMSLSNEELMELLG